jgi:hypothetical protein
LIKGKAEARIASGDGTSYALVNLDRKSADEKRRLPGVRQRLPEPGRA